MEFLAEVLYVERFTYPEGWSFVTHGHADRYHMFCIKKGSCTFLVNSKNVSAADNTVLIVPPGCEHSLTDCKDGALVDEVMFTLSGGELKDALDCICRKALPVSEANSLPENVMRYGNSRRETFRQYAGAALTSMLLGLTGGIINDSPSHINAQRIDNTGYSPITVGIIDYIDEHYASAISLDGIADHLGCNKSYICTVFKKDCGITINDYMNTIRILKAAEYISYTDRDIAYICSVTGFSSVGHFNRTFKKFLGMSPGYYKRMSPINFNETKVEPSGDLESKLNSVAEQIGSIRNIYTDNDEIR